MCRVSVVIPVYNVEKWLPACLDSVLSQTLRDIEVICVDDASPDGSGAIMDAYVAKDSRVQAVHLSENHMQGYARNRGLERAKGEYVYFLDSDDMIEPDSLRLLAAAADADALDAVFFDSRVFFENPELMQTRAFYEPVRHGKYEDRVYTGREMYRAFWEQDDWNVYVQRTFWRRDFLIGNRLFFPEPHVEHEDELFAFEAILKARRARYLPVNLFVYRIRENSVMTRGSKPKDFFGYFIVFCSMIGFLRENGLDRDEACAGNAVHIYEVMMSHYPTFLSDPDPDAWFAGHEDERLYTLFSWLQVSQETLRRRYASPVPDPLPISAGEPPDLWAPVRPFERLYLYGAGRMAEAAFRRLLLGGLVIEGFLVSDKAENPDRLHGFPVYGIDDVRPEEGAAVIVALRRSLHDEISRMLRARGWTHFLYANAKLREPRTEEPEEDGA